MQTQKDKGNFSNLFEETMTLTAHFGNLAVRVAIILFITALIFYGAVLKFETLAYADQPNDAPISASTDIIDTQPSDHPSGKDRNVEPGNSATQGKSESNPDGNGVDKPYPADKQPARSQGRNDNDGNNGCGNDNDFSDDNNGNCGGKKKETPTASPTPQESPTPKATATGATPTQLAGAVSPVVTPGVEKPAQPQPTPKVPVEQQPPVLPLFLPKAGEITFAPVWLIVIGISLVVAGFRLKKWGLRK